MQQITCEICKVCEQCMGEICSKPSNMSRYAYFISQKYINKLLVC